MLYNRGWARDFHYLIISAMVLLSKNQFQVVLRQGSADSSTIRTVQPKIPLKYEPIPASYTPGSQHIYFSCKTADCKAVFAQSPNNYPITVFVVQGIERGLPAVDWVKFLWLASHPSEKIHNDEGVPGQVLMYGSHRTPVCPSVREHWTRKLSMDHVPLNL